MPDLLDRIRDHRERFRGVRSPEVAAAEFLRLEPRLPDRQGLFDIAPGLTIEWVIEDLIASVPQGAERTGAILRLFDAASNLSERSRVLTAFGTWPERERRGLDDDDATVDEKTTAQLESRLADQVRAADHERLASEPNLRSLLGIVHRDADSDATEAFLRAARKNDRLFLAIAAACIRRIRSSSPPFMRAELETDAVVRFLRDEARIATRARAIRKSNGAKTDVEREALDLLLNDPAA